MQTDTKNRETGNRQIVLLTKQTHKNRLKVGQINKRDRQQDRRTDRHLKSGTDMQTDRKTGRHERHVDRQTHKNRETRMQT